ncbi:MAG: DUF1549 domain-containing protein [Planctomycetaceae bacterium]
MPSRLCVAALLCCVLLAPTAVSAGEVQILPSSVKLTGPAARHRLIVVRNDGKTVVGMVDDTEFTSSNPEVATIEDGIVVPHANGKATVSVATPNGTASIEVTCESIDVSHPWSFRNNVQPVLARSGCNSGACHGALAGKGGFRLSLRGYDTAADYHTIARQSRGRRIELADPGRSLLLTKPSGAVPHKGGLRFQVESENYNAIANWIADGAPEPTKEDARLEELRILPEAATLKPGDKQQMLVQAKYTDGRVSDVTSLAKFTSANEAVATVDEHGEVSVIGFGEGAISVWFDSQIVIGRVTAPYENNVSPALYAQEERTNFIDELVLAQLQRLNLKPSGKSSDSEFIRRAFIDTLGTLPTADEVREFLKDDAADKRDALAAKLLDRPEFVDYWTYRWSDILLINGTRLRPKAVEAYYKWLRGHVEANTPWDKLVSELVTSTGSSYENGATNFFALHQSPEDMAENTSQAFMGLSIGCAKCHNHPLEKWTNDQYYGFANLFSRVRAKGWGGDSRNGDGLRTLYVVEDGELVQPNSGKPQPPAPLDGEPVPFDSTVDRRVHLASWLTSPENPYFARSVTNRVWANFFGVGLVESVDDMRVSNPASNEWLLSTAADFVVENGFDLKPLMYAILTSSTYGRTSKPTDGNKDEKRFYARYYPRRLMAEVMLDAISRVTDVSTKFDQIAFPGADKQKTEFYEPGTRAIQLYDSAVASYFLKTFGRNQRLITCECERSDEPSMVQVLHISNGDTLNKKLAAKKNRLTEMLAAEKPIGEMLDEIFLTALARYPSDTERTELSKMFNAAKPAEQRVVLEDVFWSVMSSREFLFNH